MDIDIHYARNELRKALRLRNRRKDADSIARAEKRIALWNAVVEGIGNGVRETSSPMAEKYPFWVTRKARMNGSATGWAAADVPFSDEERERLAVLAPYAHASRESLFAALLSDSGLAWLRETLASREYKIEYPEDAALFVIAWLLENGQTDEALSLVKEIAPYAHILRFLPKSADRAVRAAELVHRFSSNEVRAELGRESYFADCNIDMRREALSVWIPYMDRLVAHWLALFDGNTDGAPRVPPDLPFGWLDGAKALADQYETLKERRPFCSKYHNSKENLQILLSATRDFLQNGPSASNLSRVGHVVRCYVKAHGAPGDARHAKTREEQSRTASMPGYELIALALALRLPQTDEGIENVGEFLDPISGAELGGAAAQCAPYEIPESIRKVVRKATAAPLPELIRQGIVPSPDMLELFVPQVKSMEVFRSYADENIALLVAETHKAFSRRPMPSYTQPPKGEYNDLPWVKSLRRERRGEYGVAAALRLAGYSIDFFPGVILPNTLIGHLVDLYDMSGGKPPFITYSSRNIFIVGFTPKFCEAVLAAANLLHGSLYEKYYGLDYAALKEHTSDSLSASTDLTAMFERTLRECATDMTATFEPAVQEYMMKLETVFEPYSWYGDNKLWIHIRLYEMSVELAHIYTAHNLAALVAEGVKTEHSYEELAFMACEYSLRLLKKSLGPNARVIWRLTKNAAYAWRQSLFFISLTPRETVDTFLSRFENLSASWLGPEITSQLFTGLRAAANGDSPEKGKHCPFVGWTSDHPRPWYAR
ncbi:MAG: hypothetical protein LBK91_06570 [Synergistaceae bacterium]|jgi:hypothetical protein|nr:hypothetical protein [Synergistaceae bacterium]